jgi:hypothetical protein
MGGEEFGCGTGELRTKKTLVLEADPHRYRAALSDLSGCDVETHDNTPIQVVAAVRKWLRNACGLTAPGAAKIWGDFNDFMADNYDALKAEGFSDTDIEALAIPELVERIEDWLSRRSR